MSSLPADSVPERYEQAFTNFAKRDEVRRISNEDMRSFRIFGRGGGGVARPKRRGRLEIGFVHEKVGKKLRRINGVFRFCFQWWRCAIHRQIANCGATQFGYDGSGVEFRTDVAR